MGEKEKLVIGGLLHDIGKLLYRYCDGRKHTISGFEFLKNTCQISDNEILNQIKYHHYSELKSASLKADSLAYVTYMADNISAAMDRREALEAEGGFVREQPLKSIFNLLNQHRDNKEYQAGFLDVDQINYPIDQADNYTEEFYEKLILHIRENLEGISFSREYVNSFLEVVEANMNFVPSSTNQKEQADISLYDHSKMTAALGCCIYDFIKEKTSDFREILFEKGSLFYCEQVFLVYSMDLSGIQNFIYTTSGDGALKALRSRSFYLEIFMEYCIDELLESLGLYRTNLLYSGGGHAYLICANTDSNKEKIERFEREINEWLLDIFHIELYLGGAYAECSADHLKNKPEGSYKKIFEKISSGISEKKLRRYTASQILKLKQSTRPSMRECKVCRRNDELCENGKCRICNHIESMSNGIINGRLFTILNDTDKNRTALPLPFGRVMVSDSEETWKKGLLSAKTDYIYTYGKNCMYTGYGVVTKLWVGDYCRDSSLGNLAAESQGIRRLAVLRADIDNLGQAFVRGFENEENNNRYVTLSRTATFSRKMSMFFKLHINKLLSQGEFYLDDCEEKGKRNAVIIYSGGDDVFVIGTWDDIIGFAVDLQQAFEKYTQGTLTLSAGIGIFHEKYPIAAMAEETGALESISKSMEGKQAVTLFSGEHTYKWDEFVNCILGEKMDLLRQFFHYYPEKGMGILYQMLDLIREKQKGNRMNIARFAYLLGRLEPGAKAEEKAFYQKFSQTMYRWIQSERDNRELVTAMYIYAYKSRKEAE